MRAHFTSTDRDRISEALLRILDSYNSIEVEGPLDAAKIPAGEFQLIENFKLAYAARFAPYLTNSYHRRLDANLRHVGKEVYFYAHEHTNEHTNLAGVVRLRSRPFEWESLLPEMGHYAESFKDCAEFSRLMVEPTLRGLRVGQILIGTAALWALDAGHEGVLALCRTGTYKVFQQYGLSALGEGPVRVPERENGDYHLMHGTWSFIAQRKGVSLGMLASNDALIPRDSLCPSSPN